MSRYSRPLFKIIFFILLIIVSVMVVHTLLPFIQITNRVMSTMIETGIIMIASCPFLFIIYSQHRDWAASEQRLFSLFEKNSALICEFNLEGKLLDANSKLMEVTGFTLQELRNKSYKMLIINEQIFSFEEFFEKAKKGERLNFEVTIKHKSGSFIDLGLKSVPILTGNQITSLFFIAKDITEQKKSLEQLNLVKNQLESFVNHASVAICIFDFKGRLLQVNQAFEQLFGWDKLELIGRRFPGIPHYLVPSLQIIHNKVRKKEQVTNFETVRLRKDGSEIYVNLSFSTVLDTAGNVVALAAFIRDITESKKAEEMLLKSEKLSVAGQLAAGVAHEIRNPLTTLRGFVQLMMTTSLDHGKYLEIMLSELDRINLIVGEFLILSRPHLRQSTIKDLGTIMSQVVALLEPQAMLSNVRIQVQIAATGILVECEENQLKQVFINLIKNAMEAMPSGGDIEIYLEKNEQGEAVIRLIDHGCGISAENLKKLGEPFYTTKEKGTGLGMMISYKIIEDHHGKISIQSTVGKGTAIEVRLPYLQEGI